MNHPLLLILVEVTIFSLMLAIGINLSFEKMLSLWRRPARLSRSLLAVVVLVPLLTIILLKLFSLPTAVTTGLSLLAASPGAPLLAKRAQMAGASFQYSASFQLTLALLAIFITPLTLAVFSGLFVEIPHKVTILEVSRQVFMVQFLPVILGLLLQRFGGQLVEKIAKPLTFVANKLFLGLVIILSIFGIPICYKVWGLPIIVIVLMVIGSLGIGHVLGGADTDKRSTLAISCIARNVGLAMFIAILDGVQESVLPTLIAYLILGAVLGTLYSIISKRQSADLPPTIY